MKTKKTIRLEALAHAKRARASAQKLARETARFSRKSDALLLAIERQLTNLTAAGQRSAGQVRACLRIARQVKGSSPNARSSR